MNLRNQIFYLLISGLIFGCSLKGKINNGYEAYDRKQYAVAVDMLAQEYEKSRGNKEKATAAYYLGRSYEFLKDSQQAKYWFEQAVKLEYGVEAIRDLAYANKNTGDYKNAIAIFQKLDDALGGDRTIQREIFVLEQLNQWHKPDNVDLKLAAFSSGYADYGPVIFQKNFIVFTSDRPESSSTDTYLWTGNEFSDLFISPKDGNSVRLFDLAFLDESNVGTIAFNQHYTEAIFSKCMDTDGPEDNYCQLYSSYFDNGSWSPPKRLEFQSPDINYGHPTFLAQDSVLVYSAYMESGRGEHDLYYSERVINADSSFSWSASYSLPPTINSPGREMFPTGHGDTLYFSSDYHPGYGGLDVFRTVLDGNTWSPPENMLTPINSSADDFGLIWDNESTRMGLKKGYFTSSRDGLGNDDIYAFTIRETVEEDTIVSSTPEEEIIEGTVFLAVKVRTPIYENDDPNAAIIRYEEVPNALVSISGGSEDLFLTTDKEGLVVQEIGIDARYNIIGRKNGYFADKAEISTQGMAFTPEETSVTRNVTLTLNPIYVEKEIVLKNIYYDYDAWSIREDAKPALDSLSQVLQLNPNIRIELASHTDCRGEVDYNIILSQRRAQAAVDYIVDQGVNGRRLIAKGYGENEPEVDCICEECTEEEHQQNRRTTFKIMR